MTAQGVLPFDLGSNINRPNPSAHLANSRAAILGHCLFVISSQRNPTGFERLPKDCPGSAGLDQPDQRQESQQLDEIKRAGRHPLDVEREKYLYACSLLGGICSG
ncbi:hypothetical protein ASPWEDRAFT_683704 [Aspergillus wentii DTO 134E9]|uniref:Uncharacterized protein n=1 Tax=Aspergillus wentii DTO 134E9 TaxID=1073089 RepID=A0A1L9R891_ASPWE|nr:uncharacterized protein ASPWEDRAFT_683704 [Aspergillus wentii DTO 134E9]OJJ31142.1 hypothetical protein ASPWEDRAFT_683704 [Aspergillus wentii DTO 134E9]